MNDETLEARTLAHRRILQLMLSELVGTSAGGRLEQLLRERSTLQDGQEDPGSVETAGLDITLAIAEEFRLVLEGLPRSPDEAPEPVRPAGPEAMRDAPEHWDSVDEASDESFPASDPPASA